MLLKKFLLPLGILFSTIACAFAGEGTIDTGDTAWVTMSTALVMMMTPAGLALFYGGMSRYKNLLNTIAMTMVAYCIASIVWVGWGYSLAFGESTNLFIGNLSHIFLNGINIHSISGTIPTIIFVVFQMTFACISVAIILGSAVDRMKFSAWIVFTILWLTLVYTPVCNWVWGGGWMHKMGALDFAGGNVVHINAGVSGLVLALFLGKRQGYGKKAMVPSSVTFTALGAGLLWFGWFGFNAGSALGANGIHGLCGIWGALATGLFASPSITEGAAGLFYGNPGQLWIQFVSIIGTIAFSAIATLIVIMITRIITNGIRVDAEDELAGLDNALHGERAFEIE